MQIPTAQDLAREQRSTPLSENKCPRAALILGPHQVKLRETGEDGVKIFDCECGTVFAWMNQTHYQVLPGEVSEFLPKDASPVEADSVPGNTYEESVEGKPEGSGFHKPGHLTDVSVPEETQKLKPEESGQASVPKRRRNRSGTQSTVPEEGPSSTPSSVPDEDE